LPKAAIFKVKPKFAVFVCIIL